MVFCDFLLSLSIMFSRSIHVTACVSASLIFIALFLRKSFPYYHWDFPANFSAGPFLLWPAVVHEGRQTAVGTHVPFTVGS